MNILTSLKFHAWEDNELGFLSSFLNCDDVRAGVVVGYSNERNPHLESGIHDERRDHFNFRTG